MGSTDRRTTGLVLTGGGARTAYQAGVLKAVAEILPQGRFPFQVVTGASAGAVNGAALAAGAPFFRKSCDRLSRLWCELEVGDVYRSDPISLSSLGLTFLLDLISGGKASGPVSNYLLDTAPLGNLLRREVDFQAIARNVNKGVIGGFAVSATNYRTGMNITFYDSRLEQRDWVRSRRLSVRQQITLEHILASSAIPVFFPPVVMDGSYFGDGSIRLSSPLSPAIHMGAEKLFAIGVRQEGVASPPEPVVPMSGVMMADIAGLLLNAIFMDSLSSDLERLARVNRTVALLSDEGRNNHPDRLRHIDVLVINPSEDLGLMAKEQFKNFPFFLRHLLGGIGATEDTGSELVSYLAFDKRYTSRLHDLGYKDAMAKRDEVRDFLSSPSAVG